MDISLTPIILVFAFIMLGFTCRKQEWISQEQVRGISFLAMNIALPCLILKSFNRINLAEVFDPDIYITYYSCAFLAFFTGLLYARLILKMSEIKSGLMGMGACFSNLGLIGLPIVEATWGEQGVTILAIVLSIHPATLFSLTIITIELSGKKGGENSKAWYIPVLGLFKNMIILAVLTGGTLSLLEIKLPDPVIQFTELMAGSAGPCALFCVGAFLAQAKFSQSISTLAIVPIKIALMPFLVYYIGTQFIGLASQTAIILCFLAALPSGANVSTLSQYYRTAEPEISGIISASTLASFLTLPVIFWILS